MTEIFEIDPSAFYKVKGEENEQIVKGSILIQEYINGLRLTVISEHLGVGGVIDE